MGFSLHSPLTPIGQVRWRHALRALVLQVGAVNEMLLNALQEHGPKSYLCPEGRQAHQAQPEASNAPRSHSTSGCSPARPWTSTTSNRQGGITGNRTAVRFEYEWHDDVGQWWRSHGNENWEFDELGYMKFRFASINDQPIAEADRKFHWERKA